MCTIQAGVAMGLAKTVAVRFPEWGPDFATLMVSMAAMQPVLQQFSEGFLCLPVHAQPSWHATVGSHAILHNGSLTSHLIPLVIGSLYTCHAEVKGFGAVRYVIEQCRHPNCTLTANTMTHLYVDRITADLCHHHEHDGRPTLVQKGDCADRGSPRNAASCSFTGA